MQTTTETLTVDGTVLNTLAINIESLTGRLRSPGKRGSNVVIPGRHGSLRTERKYYEEGALVLPMWVAGCDPDGLIPTGSRRREFFKNIDTLSELFGGDTLLEVRHTLPDATVRRCGAEVLAAIDYSTDAWAEPVGKFTVALTVPAAFWTDLAATIQTLKPPVGLGAGSTVMSLTSFATSTAPMDDMIVRFTGPLDSPLIVLPNGDSLQYQATIPSGRQISIDCGNWTITSTGGTAMAVDYTKLIHPGKSARWLSIPAKPTPPTFTFSNPGPSDTTAASAVVFEGLRKYLVG